MIKIGIIDSGIARERRKGKCNIEGVCLKRRHKTGTVYSAKSIVDRIGHGSDCFRIIAAAVPVADYFIVKIFERELSTDVDILAAAIQICVDRGVDIINISAGVRADQIPEPLRIACDKAYENNTAIISAKHNKGTTCYPAGYSRVIGVDAASLAGGERFRCGCGNEVTFYSSAADMFSAGIPWSQSTSFACAKMTGYAGLILARKGRMTFEDLVTELMNEAQIRNSKIQ